MKKKILGVAALAMMLVGLVATPVGAVSCPSGTSRSGESVSSLAECNLVKDESLWPTVLNIINVILGVLGVVTVIVVILGGVQYVTSAGDPAKAKKAKDTIMYGVIGLVVALLAWAIVNFVVGAVVGVGGSSGGSGGSGSGSGSGGSSQTDSGSGGSSSDSGSSSSSSSGGSTTE